MRPFRRRPPWMQRAMAYVVLALFAVDVLRCALALAISGVGASPVALFGYVASMWALAGA